MTAVASNPSKEEETEQSLVEKQPPPGPLNHFRHCVWMTIFDTLAYDALFAGFVELPTLVLMSSFQVNRYCNGILRRISNQSKQQWRSYKIGKQSQCF